MARDGFHFMRGEAHWAKILGSPVDNYERDGKEWTIEIKPDAEGMELLEELEVEDRVNKGENKDRILFRQRAKRPDGEDNRPLTVVGPDNKPWDQSKLIGNGTIVDIKFKYVDNGRGKKSSLYPQGVRILEHVPYERQEFAPLNEDDQFFREPQAAVEDREFRRDFDLDDEEVM